VLQKISAADLMVGMYVVDTGLSWLEHPYLFSQEGPIASEAALRGIREAGYLEVFVDTDKGSLVPLGFEPGADSGTEPGADVGAAEVSQAQVSLEQELAVAKIVYHDCLLIARDALQAIQSGGTIDVRACSDTVSAVVDSAVRNPDALLTLCKLRRHDAYTFTHGVNVSVLAAAFGGRLGLPVADLQELGLAGLYHDLGKTGIPDAILNKPARLTEAEFSCMRQHPALGGAILSGFDLPEAVLRGVTEHHERHDGSGYPQGLSGTAIHKWARVLALADVYDALTSRRCYKGPMLPTRALAVIHGMRGRDFPTALAERFIKFLGPYPVGSYVRLTNGECGFVRGSNPLRALAPEILVVRDAAGEFLAKPRRRQLAGEEKRSPTVAEALDPAVHGLDPATYLLGTTDGTG
jgi:HD-GYP domain-containing protein (c-di-GMP phosphodiesterase class II)